MQEFNDLQSDLVEEKDLNPSIECGKLAGFSTKSIEVHQ
jgi:hypothetical protein